MGCLFEFLADIFFEMVVNAYVELMCLIVPEHKLSHKADRIIRTAVCVFSVILFLAIIAGIILLLQPAQNLKNLGYYLTFIPLGIIAIQIVAGVIIRIKNKRK